MRPPSRHTWLASAAALALLAVMVSVSRDFGATWDEPFQQHYGELIWGYLHGQIPRDVFDVARGNQFLYGGLFELIAVTAQHAFAKADVYVVRHMVNAVFGWIGIVYVGLLAARAAGPRAGWIAAAFMTLSPRYIGDAMNNPKDLPFAALAIAALYYTLTIDWQPPYLSWRRTALLGTAIALAIDVRSLGIVLLAYAIGFVMLVATCSMRARCRGTTFRTGC
jgi:Dolichyl-phosphate-mannose-protein mannosyltransferase